MQGDNDMTTTEQRLAEELEKCRKWNHAVSVCRDHVDDIVMHDGCVICEIDRLNLLVEQYRKENDMLKHRMTPGVHDSHECYDD